MLAKATFLGGPEGVGCLLNGCIVWQGLRGGELLGLHLQRQAADKLGQFCVNSYIFWRQPRGLPSAGSDLVTRSFCLLHGWGA